MARFIADWLGRPAPAPLGTGITSVSATPPLHLALVGSSIIGSVDALPAPPGTLASVTEAVAGDGSVTVSVASAGATALQVTGMGAGGGSVSAVSGVLDGGDALLEAAGDAAVLSLATNDAAIRSKRWTLTKESRTTEMGANAGSSLTIDRYDDGGNLLGTVLTLIRATGRAIFGSAVKASSVGFVFPDDTVQATKFDQDDNARVAVAKAATPVGTRRRINLVEGPNVTLTVVDNPGAERVDVTVSSLGPAGGASLADGDYGDITASAGGTVLTVDPGAITYAKIQDVSATDKILGRSSAGAGVVQEIPCTAAGRAILDDVDAAAQRTTLGAISQDGNARVAVKKAGSVVGTRRGLNLIEGTGVTLTVADDAGNEEVDVTIAASGGGGGATLRAQTYETGSGNWVAPAGLLAGEAWVTGCGGGGGGGGKTYQGSSYNGGGGGGGASCFRRKVTVVAGNTYAYAVGAGGAAGASASADGSTTAGSAGGSTTLGAVLTLVGGSGGGRGLIGSFATAGAGGAAGGPGGTPGTHGPTTNGGLATPGGVSFPPGWGHGGEGSSLTSTTAGGGAATAGRGGYLLIEWNE